MKKLISFGLIAVMLLGLGGCNGDTKKDATTPSNNETTTKDSSSSNGVTNLVFWRPFTSLTEVICKK